MERMIIPIYNIYPVLSTLDDHLTSSDPEICNKTQNLRKLIYEWRNNAGSLWWGLQVAVDYIYSITEFQNDCTPPSQAMVGVKWWSTASNFAAADPKPIT